MSGMNIIDISSWQKGIDLATVFKENPLDGVVVKATEGTNYVNPYFTGWAMWLKDNGKPLGLYHFLAGGNAEAEAAFFVNTIRPYIGHAVLFADYESDALKRGTGYLKNFLDTVLELTGVRPLVYCSLSVVQSQDFNAIASAGYKLWLAQYASNNVVNGFQEHPWQQGSVAPFNGFVMHQYTGNGRLKGYNGSLDLDLFNGSFSSWIELAKGEDSPELKDADPEVVRRVLAGEFGTGEERRQGVTQAGYDPDKVQNTVNTLYMIAFKCLRDIVPYEQYIDSIMKIIKS